MMMHRGRYTARSTQQTGSDELNKNLELFIEGLFKVNRMNKIAAIIIAIMVIVGHVWLGCR